MVTEKAPQSRILQGSVMYIYQAGLFLLTIVAILYILGVHQRLGIRLYQEQYYGIFLALMLFSIFISRSASPKHVHKVPWYDWILAILGVVVGIYITIYYPQVVLNYGEISTGRFIISSIAIILILEAIRRMVGWILVIIIICFAMYAYVAPYMPGPLKGTSRPTDQLLNYLYLDVNSILGMLGIASTLAFAFVLFGSSLLNLKGGDILNNIALLLFGRFRGGPAKASVVGSSLAGTITGGPVTNVVLTGTVTIPLMKRNRFSAVEAGAIESVASTGGQIMPPVMGVAAFLIAETLQIPYAEVALAALIPAILFYVCLFIQVDLLARRRGIGRLPAEELPKLQMVIRTTWMIVPAFACLIYLLFVAGYTPAKAGLYSSLFALTLLFQRDVFNEIFSRIKAIFVDAGKIVVEIGIILAGAGIVIGITGMTGLGFNLAYFLSKLGEYGLFILLLATAIISIILGMGLPSVAAYALVATLTAPALVELGVEPLIAHLFVFYYAILSSYTPPIALACFAAAPIAQANPNRIGLTALKIGFSGFIVPFIMVYSPKIVIIANNGLGGQQLMDILFAVIACLLGCIAISGYLFKSISMIKRIVIGILSFLIIAPISGQPELLNIICMVIAIAVIGHEWYLNRVLQSSNEKSQVI